ncbi:hypothetical protein [Phenylobacterium sp.]|jgi:hypothetical protein|uniref:hypothetical protein n=1 Tax=Phenylobacterium sp. TaxID=1871053 RepID=UPI002F94FA1B
MTSFPALPVTLVEGVNLTDDREHCLLHLQTETGPARVAIPAAEAGRLGALLLGVSGLRDAAASGGSTEAFVLHLGGWRVGWTDAGDAVLGLEFASGGGVSVLVAGEDVERFRDTLRR